MSRTREIIKKYFTGAHSESIRKMFIAWFRDSPDNIQKENTLKDIWEELDIKADASTERSYNTLLSNIRRNSPEIFQRRSIMYRISRIAAILTLPIISAAIMYFIMKDHRVIDSKISLVECIVPHGEIRTITLPDSSVVKVNSGSILIYPEQFTDSRDIFLNGEAYFSVARNESKPFIVKTTDLEVEVLGTVFNVSSYTDNESSSTTLESGKVNVKFRNSNKESIVLQPNEQISYNRLMDTVEKHTVRMDNIIAWTQGNLVIQSMTIDEIAQIIERKYALKVNLNSHKYKDERITIKVNKEEDITEFMTALAYLVPQLKYRMENDTLYIY